MQKPQVPPRMTGSGVISAQHKMAPVSLWPEAALQTWVAAQASQNHGQPCTQPPLRPAHAGKADLTAQLRGLVPHLGVCWARSSREPSAPPSGVGGGGARKEQEREAASGKGVSEQQPWVPGPLSRHGSWGERGRAGSCGAACSHGRPTWNTPVTVSPCFTSGPAASTSTGFRLQDRNPHVKPSSLGCLGPPGAQPDTGCSCGTLCDLRG